MSRTLLALFVVMAIISCSFGQPPQCGQNEEFTNCGSACEPSCAKPRSDICTYQCVIGCQCSSGFLRNAAGSCVAPEAC